MSDYTQRTIYVYVHPDEDISTYPKDLFGDMSVFKGFQFEVQWVFYLMLKDQGLDVQICREYPKSGIFIIHMGNVKQFVWNRDLYVISGQWDYRRDDRAQLHLVSNHYKTTKASLGFLDRISGAGLQCYEPPVTHSVVIPRDDQHGDRFENIAFIGDPKNLDKAFCTESFRLTLEEMGMKFILVKDPHAMADFSNIDAVLAIRKLGKVINNKPPTKLINAWRGGVPALLGTEIGYREVREDDLDYIEVDSVDEVIAALKRLKEDSMLRQMMVVNGFRRAAPYTAEHQKESWGRFFKEVVFPADQDWMERSVLSRLIFLAIRWLRYNLRTRISYVWHRLLKQQSRDYT